MITIEYTYQFMEKLILSIEIGHMALNPAALYIAL